MKLYYTNKKSYQDKLENHYYFIIKPLNQAYKIKVQENILKNKCNNMYNVYIEI